MPEPRDWADLPSELVHLIYKKLPADHLYVIRFRAVCKNWRSSAPLSDRPPQLPWIIECDKPSRKSYLEPKLRFYSLVGGETGTIRVPEPYHGMVYYGPGHGYLLVSSLEDYIYLLNPLTSDKIPLPKLDELMIWSPVVSGSDPMHNWHIVSCRMTNLDDWVSVIYNSNVNDWINLENFSCGLTCNTCCWDGKLFVTEGGGCTEVYDAVSREILYEVPPPEDEEFLVFTTYLVESCGEILRVSWYRVSDIVYDETDHEVSIKKKETDHEVEFPMFDIYKLYSDEVGKHSWAEVSDIGDQILFLDMMNGFSMRAPAGFEGNCIYFFLYDGTTPCRYDIGTETVDRVPCPFKNFTWFIPSVV